jgi:hypothetical protein
MDRERHPPQRPTGCAAMTQHPRRHPAGRAALTRHPRTGRAATAGHPAGVTA